MLKKLRLTNFKAFGDPGLQIEPGLITVLIGPNGTGKSSVLQALLLLKQSQGKESLDLNGRFVQLESYRDVTHRGIEGAKVKFSLTVNTNLDDASLHFSYDVTLHEGAMELNHCWIQYRSRREDFSLDLAWNATTGSRDHDISFRGTSFHLASTNDVARPIRISGWTSPRPERRAEFEREKTLLEQIVGVPATWLSGQFFHIPSIRALPSSLYSLAASPDTDLQNLEEQPGTKVASTYLYMQNQRTTADEAIQVMSRIYRITGAKVSPSLQDGPSVRMESSREGLNSPLNLLNEGFGTNPLVHLFLQLAKASAGSTIGIEEPEIHLHPRAQGELAKVLAETAKEERKQLILTTHSEHILTGLLTRVAAGTLEPGELAIYSFARDQKTGEARADRLEVTDKGAVKGGLKDFFEVDWKEVSEYVEALSKRQR